MKPLTATASACWIVGVEGTVRAGFPTPADDYGQASLDISKQLVQHPQSTYFMRVSGDSMTGAGIFDGDYVVIDRSIKPVHGHVVVAVVESEFTLKYLRTRGGRFRLEAANPTYPPIIPKEGACVEVWGVATHTIHPLPGSPRWK